MSFFSKCTKKIIEPSRFHYTLAYDTNYNIRTTVADKIGGDFQEDMNIRRITLQTLFTVIEEYDKPMITDNKRRYK